MSRRDIDLVRSIGAVTLLKMTDLDLEGKVVLIREDMNVPVEEGRVTSDARIRAALPTVRQAMDAGARVIVMSHLGRPTEGEYAQEFSMQPVAARLTELLGVNVPVIRDWLDGVDFGDGNIVLSENVRFNAGEKKNDPELAKRMAALCDIFVMDAFGTSHRAQASTEGVARFAATACAGPLLVNELVALDRALKEPARPVVAVVGGSKVSTKLTVLQTLSGKVDHLIVGGGIANNCLAAAGHAIGTSLAETDMLAETKHLLNLAETGGAAIPLPTDVVVAKEFSATAEADLRSVTEVGDDEMILDIGPDTAEHFASILAQAGTIVWNGPVGVFEIDQFGEGTRMIANAIAESPAFSIAGGGDTIAAMEKYQVRDGISYVSTGGGAFLEFLEGKTLPAVAVLEQRAEQKDCA